MFLFLSKVPLGAAKWEMTYFHQIPSSQVFFHVGICCHVFSWAPAEEVDFHSGARLNDSMSFTQEAHSHFYFHLENLQHQKPTGNEGSQVRQQVSLESLVALSESPLTGLLQVNVCGVAPELLYLNCWSFSHSLFFSPHPLPYPFQGKYNGIL